MIKQITTGPSGNRLPICLLRFEMVSPKISIDLGCASVNKNSWGGNPESLGENRSAYYPQDQSLFVYWRTFFDKRLSLLGTTDTKVTYVEII